MKPTEYVPHERYNREHPLLRELVSIAIYSHHKYLFATLLTRVPCVGEVIAEEERLYRVEAVEHARVDDDGRASFGYHATVDVLQIVDDFPTKIFKVRKRKTQNHGMKRH